jgi:hypothetical protein
MDKSEHGKNLRSKGCPLARVCRRRVKSEYGKDLSKHSLPEVCRWINKLEHKKNSN